MMYDALGYPPEHPDRAIARRAVDKLLVVREDEAYCQPCVSPVWDTALVGHALMEVGGEEAVAAAQRGLDWLQPLQELDVKGDWAERRPDVRPGGWAFQYRNAHYPDLDDTAVVVMAMDRARREFAAGDRYDEAIARGAEWIDGLQSRNGGWGAFDADNVDHYLNNIPFADHGALLDPPTADVSARCVGMLAQLGETHGQPAHAGRARLPRARADGGRKLVRPLGRELHLRHLVGALRAERGRPRRDGAQRAQGGGLAGRHPERGRRLGRGLHSYKLDYRGYEPAPSTASQTAWALLGLMAAGEVDHPAVARGIAYLQQTQDATGLWRQDAYTGGGFPRVFYLRYHGYPKFFPLWALARYRNLRRSNVRRVAYGM